MRIEPLNKEHSLSIGIALGLAAAMNYLRDDSEIFGKLPGYMSAIAKVQEIEARHRADLAGLNFRAALADGVDITTHMVGMRGRGEIYAAPMDIEELAEFSGKEEPK